MVEQSVLVSVIVPVYGTETYLSACIESLCNQTYSHLQIILVDDQSKDRCPEICDAYAEKDARITVIHQKNKGVSGARNTGLRHATGRYIMFVDSDDELLPNAVEILLQQACLHGADVVSAMSETVDETGGVIQNNNDGTFAVYQNDEPLLLLLDENPNTYVVWAKIYRAEFIKDIYFTEGKNNCEDSFFLFQCYLRKPLLIQHNAVIYRQNIRSGSTSRSGLYDSALSMLYFLERKKEYILAHYPQYTEKLYHMEVCTNLRVLDVLCGTTDKKHIHLQKQSIRTVRRLHMYYLPINKHHEQLVRLVVYGLYPMYKWLVRLKYYRK